MECSFWITSLSRVAGSNELDSEIIIQNMDFPHEAKIFVKILLEVELEEQLGMVHKARDLMQKGRVIREDGQRRMDYSRAVVKELKALLKNYKNIK